MAAKAGAFSMGGMDESISIYKRFYRMLRATAGSKARRDAVKRANADVFGQFNRRRLESNTSMPQMMGPQRL